MIFILYNYLININIMSPEGFPQKPQNLFNPKHEVALPGNENELSKLTTAYQFKKAYEKLLEGKENLPKKLAILKGWETLSIRGIERSKNMAELAVVEEDASIGGKIVIKNVAEEIMKKKIYFIGQCGTLEDLAKLPIDYKKADGNPEIKKAYFDKLHELIGKCGTLEDLKKFSYLVDHNKTNVNPEIKKAYFDRLYALISKEFVHAEQTKDDDFALEAVKIFMNIFKESPEIMEINMLNPGKSLHDFKKMAVEKILEIYNEYLTKTEILERSLRKLSDKNEYNKAEKELEIAKNVLTETKKAMGEIPLEYLK